MYVCIVCFQCLWIPTLTTGRQQVLQLVRFSLVRYRDFLHCWLRRHLPGYLAEQNLHDDGHNSSLNYIAYSGKAASRVVL